MTTHRAGSGTAEVFGRDVMGPVVAEFCLRLWTLEGLLPDPEQTALLFCARGGLRMQLAYEHFCTAMGLPARTTRSALMVSRAVAIRPALVRYAHGDAEALSEAVASTLRYEFSHRSTAEVAVALSGEGPVTQAPRWSSPMSPETFAALLRHPDGRAVVGALDQAAALFTRHLDARREGAGNPVLVDTGLFGTTRLLLSEGYPQLRWSSALLARTFRPGSADQPRTFGLLVSADGYRAHRRRTALLRYWHFVEWMFEPELPSVERFEEHAGGVRSNLEIPGWQDRVEPQPGSVFAGVVDYIDALTPTTGAELIMAADRAWDELHRAIVRPLPHHGEAMAVGSRTNGFGLDGSWSARPWRGPVAALRGSSMWREGEIARSGSRLRPVLLAGIEAGYQLRLVRRSLARIGRS